MDWKNGDGTGKDLRQEGRRSRLVFENLPTGRRRRLNGDEPVVISGDHAQMGPTQIKPCIEGFEILLVGVEERNGGGIVGRRVILRHPGTEAPCK